MEYYFFYQQYELYAQNQKVMAYFFIYVKQDLSLPIISALTIHNEKKGDYNYRFFKDGADLMREVRE